MPPFQRLYGNARAHRSPPDGKNCIDRCVKGSRDDMGTIWGLDGEMNQKAIGIKGICGSWGIPVYQSFTGFGWLQIFAGKKPI